MTIDLNPRRSSTGAPQRISLVRCHVCQRTEECTPASIMWLMQDGGAMCCGHQMELFIQSGWPGQGSGVVPTPAARSIPTAGFSDQAGNRTAAWHPAAQTDASQGLLQATARHLKEQGLGMFDHLAN